MKEIKNVDEAIKFLTRERGFKIEDISKFKWKISDSEFSEYFKTDKDLINFAINQKESE